MSIRSFYMPRYFEKRNSKRLLQILLFVWVLILIWTVGDNRSAWFVSLAFAIICLYQIIGIGYLLRHKLYLEPGELYQRPKSVPPEKFLKSVKKEVKHGKK